MKRYEQLTEPISGRFDALCGDMKSKIIVTCAVGAWEYSKEWSTFPLELETDCRIVGFMVYISLNIQTSIFSVLVFSRQLI